MNPAITLGLRKDAAVPEQCSVAASQARWRSGSACAQRPVAQAVPGGFDADRVGWACACGCQAALRALLPRLPADAVAAHPLLKVALVPAGTPGLRLLAMAPV